MRVRSDAPSVCARVYATGLEGGDLRHVEHIPDVEPRSGDLDPAEAVDREVPERVRRRLRRERERGDRDGEKREPLHRRARFATGAHNSEKCGKTASYDPAVRGSVGAGGVWPGGGGVRRKKMPEGGGGAHSAAVAWARNGPPDPPLRRLPPREPRCGGDVAGESPHRPPIFQS